MRRFAGVVFIASMFGGVCEAQTSAPLVPFDPYELVTGNDKSVAKPMDRMQGLTLLNRAKRPMRLLMPSTPPYLLTVHFSAAGDAASSGLGEFFQLWLGSSWRFTVPVDNRLLPQDDLVERQDQRLRAVWRSLPALPPRRSPVAPSRVAATGAARSNGYFLESGDRRHVALHAQQRNHGRLPQQNRAYQSAGLWV
jgi:hypothetical protein